MIKDNFNFGYACLNTELRKKKIFCSRTCRIPTIEKKGMEYVKSLATQNVKDLLTILEWNLEHKIFFMRISSDLCPFASHEKYGYSLDFLDPLFKKIGDFAKEHGIRLTMHPGQYNALASPRKEVIENTFRDLNHHCNILDKIGLGVDSVMVIHGSGVYGDKPESLKRLAQNLALLPIKTRNRIALENCEMSYCVKDLLPISEALGVPIIIDFHHDSIYESTEPVQFYFDRVYKVWNDRGIKPKVHVSNSVPGVNPQDNKTKRRKHSDYIHFLHDALLTIDFPLDVMFECKMKEAALLRFLKESKE